ncbi:MAG: hypothetical protein Kow0065_14290 [Methylomicrobium sp.]
MLTSCAGHPSIDPVALQRGDRLFEQGDPAAALQEWRSIKKNDDVALLLRRARAYQALGQIPDAARFAETALKHAQPNQIGDILVLLANIELTRGQKQQATRHLAEAQNYRFDDPRSAVQLAAVNGRLALLDNRTDQAIAQFTLAQQLAGELNDSILYQEMAISRWEIYFNQQLKSPNDVPQPIDIGREEWQALRSMIEDTMSLPDSAAKDFLSIKLARLVLNIPELWPSAEQLLHGATASLEQRGDLRLLSYALGYLGSLAEQRQNDTEALTFTARAAFAAQQTNAPESLYLWEWQSARIKQRQNLVDDALDAYRRALFSLQKVRLDIGSPQTFRERVSPLFVAFGDLLLKTARQETDRQQSQNLLHETREVLEQLKTAELQDYFQDRCVANVEKNTLGLEAIAAQTAVLYPVLLPDRTEILVGLPNGLEQFVIPVDNRTISQEINDFRYKLEKRTTYQYLRHAKQLYRWLIAPLLPALHRHHIDTLVIVPDGPLRTIPLAALHDGKRYLVEEFAVAVTPGLALTDPHPIGNESFEILLNGLTQAVQDFPPLPAVSEELETIFERYGGTLLKDEDFRLLAFEHAIQKTPYRIVHIASHGQFDRNLAKTFLLTYDGKLTMDLLEQSISIGKYRHAPVELLTLSACQTAAGDERAALGLAGVAVKAGARSALASLWLINDQAASELVGAFYRRLKNSPSKADALKQAQLELLSDPRYRHAFFWAPFLLIGNWL